MTRAVAVARPDDPELLHLAVVGDTYTVLISGEQTGGRYAMLDMLIPAGGGPPPHSHGFDECFRVLEGSIEVRVGDAPAITLEQGDSVNVPADAPHSFRNPTGADARLLCTVVPSGLEEFFAEFGDSVATRTSPPPPLTDAEREERMRRAAERAPAYGMRIFPPPGAAGE